MTYLLVLLAACSFFGDARTGKKAADTAAPTRASSRPSAKDDEPAAPPKGKTPLMLPGTRSGPGEPEVKVTADQCNQIEDGGPVKMNGCITDRIECGQSIVGHTRGGVNLLNTRWYEKNYCWPATEQKDGGDERIYAFSFPDDGAHVARFTMDSPCADLDIAVFTWDKQTCPTGKEEGLFECEMKREKGTKRESVEAVTDGGRLKDWLVVVEGVRDEEGPFSITVQCGDGVHW